METTTPGQASGGAEPAGRAVDPFKTLTSRREAAGGSRGDVSPPFRSRASYPVELRATLALERQEEDPDGARAVHDHGGGFRHRGNKVARELTGKVGHEGIHEPVEV